MPSSSPWSVKGIPPEMRAAAKTAARRSGMTLGEWLNTAISDQASDGADDRNDRTDEAGTMAAPAQGFTAGPSSQDSFERAATRLEDIARQLSRIARQESDVASYSYAPPVSRLESENFSRLLQRVEGNERQAVEAFSAVNERLSILSRQFAQAAKAGSKPEDSPAFNALEKAVRNIVEHMEASEKRNRDQLRSLQDRMAEMASKASSANNEQLIQQAPVFQQLESRFAELARRVDHSENTASRGLQEVVRKELHDLAGRIDTVRETAEQLAARAQHQAVAASQQELQAIEQRILGLLQETQHAMQAPAGVPAQELQQLQTELQSLRGRIDDSRRGLASDQDVRALRQSVEQLSKKVSQAGDSRPLVEMDRRIVEIAQRLQDTQAAQQHFAYAPDLEQRFSDLEQRLSTAMAAPASDNAIQELQQQLYHVNERVGRAEQQVSNFEKIERAITQLYDGLEQTRNNAKLVAEEAASRVAEQFAQYQQQHPQQQTFSLAGAPEIIALQEGLDAVRNSSESADKRNQDTLVAVHDTLEHIVSKLSELETAAIGQRVASVVGTPPQASTEERAASAFAGLADQTAHAQPAHNSEPQPAAYEPATAGFEPAMDVAKIIPGQSEPQLAPLSEEPHAFVPNPDIGGAIDGKDSDDFIAAARRAAQAAQGKSVLNGIAPSAARLSEEGSRKILSKFKLPFLGKKAAKKPVSSINPDLPKPPPEIKPAKAVGDDGKRRKLIILGAILLLGALGYMQFSGGTPDMPAETPPPAAEPEKQSSVTPQVPVANESPAAVAKSDSAPEAPATSGQTLAQTEPAAPNPQASASEPDEVLTGSMDAEPVESGESGTGTVTAEPSEDQASKDALAMLPSQIGPTKLKAAAAAGDTKAQFIIATQYIEGSKVPQNAEQAAYWFGRAAKADLAPAQYRLATLYERGQGVEKDMKAALQWYERAAALGNIRSMHNAAVISAGNEAGAPDYARAFKWFSLASAHGLKDSQFNLAVLLERGLGTKANPAEAAFWYSAAALQNDTDAKRRADLIAAGLSADESRTLKDRLAKWKPQIAPPAANYVDVSEAQWKDSALKATGTDNGNEIAVGRAQDLLKQLGYNVGTEKGKLSPRTAIAIKLFQMEEGLKADGQLTPELLNQLEARVG